VKPAVVLWLVSQDVSLILHLAGVCDDDATADLVGGLVARRIALLKQLGLEVHVGMRKGRHGRFVIPASDGSRRYCISARRRLLRNCRLKGVEAASTGVISPCHQIAGTHVNITRGEIGLAWICAGASYFLLLLLAFQVRWRERSRTFRARVAHWVHHYAALSHGLVADARLLAEEIDALVLKNLIEDERDRGGLNRRRRARSAQLHLDSDVESHEVLHAVQVPRVNVDVVDRGRENEDSIQLPDPVCREVDSDAVEQSMFQPLLWSVDSDMEYGTSSQPNFDESHPVGLTLHVLCLELQNFPVREKDLEVAVTTGTNGDYVFHW
jgi:hypothetical protein